MNGRLEHAISLLRDVRGARLTALFAPEHGLWGAPQDHATIATDRDPVTGMRVSSLYGERREPTPSMLAGLDVMVIDLQDVGSRYYTFAWTMALTMRACARAGVAVMVLDRPNPLGGEILEGNIPDPAFASFVGLHPLPIRHGLTIGEHARYLVREHGYGCALTVVPMRGWRRRMLWEDTGVPWVAPSPNMPTLDTARVYPGGCLIEGTNLSEGRGTTRPFEWIGAPWLDAHAYAAALTAARLPGVKFRPARFTPTFHKWANRLCGGVQVHVTDQGALQAGPDLPGGDCGSPAAGAPRLPLEAPTLRVRAPAPADRHPAGHRHDQTRDRARTPPTRHRAHLAPRPRPLAPPPHPRPPLSLAPPPASWIARPGVQVAHRAEYGWHTR